MLATIRACCRSRRTSRCSCLRPPGGLCRRGGLLAGSSPGPGPRSSLNGRHCRPVRRLAGPAADQRPHRHDGRARHDGDRGHDPERPLHRGRPRRQRSARARGRRPARPHGGARPHRQPQPHRPARHPARLSHAARMACHNRRRAGGARGAREDACQPAGSSPRWAAGTRRSSPRSGCRRWPNSMRPCPRTRCWCFRRSPARPQRTRGAAPSSRRRASRSATPGDRRQRPVDGGAQRAARDPDARRPEARHDGRDGLLGAVGVTTNADMGAFNLPGTANLQGSFEADTLASADPFRMYERCRRAPRERRLSTRLRMFFLTMDTRPGRAGAAERLRTTFDGFGDDMLKVSGIGEFASAGRCSARPRPPTTARRWQRIARAGWAFQQHSLSAAENELTIATFETVNRTTPIAPLRWSLAHVGTIDAARTWRASRRSAPPSPCIRINIWPADGAARRCAPSWTAASRPARGRTRRRFRR